MKRIYTLVAAIVLSTGLFSQALVPGEEGSSVRFRIKNLGFNVTGSFSGLDGAIHFDAAKPASASFEVSIDANTVNTGIDMRDSHLRKEDYFDVKNHPRIRFVSTKVTNSTKAGTFFLYGNLTIKGTTKEISFPFSATPNETGYLFEGEFKINRRDFKVGGGSTVGDNLTVMLKVQAKKGS
jgi:polyisoprenoid-binding protein YceI